MGSSGSKIQGTDDYKLYKEEMMDVYFVQLGQMLDCTTTPQQLHALLGLNIPHPYTLLNGTPYPYIYCISILQNINKIVDEYRYKIGLISKQSILKSEFNADYKVKFRIDENRKGGYQLVKR